MRRVIAFAKLSTFAALIRPYTTRLEIAGSIRRKKADVKDGELVAIAAPGLLDFLDHLVAVGAITKAEYGANGSHRWGPKYRGLIWRGLRVEIFLTDAHSWGYQFALRTGPGEANTSLMGLLPRSPIRVRDGEVLTAKSWTKVGDKWRGVDERRLHVPTESRWFTLLGMPFILPEFRHDDFYLKAIQWARGHQWGNPADHLIAPDEMVATQPALIVLDAAARYEDPALVADQDKHAARLAERAYFDRLPVTDAMRRNRERIERMRWAVRENLPVTLPMMPSRVPGRIMTACYGEVQRWSI
jgi:hypothetical protein